ncbi:hypothetical protein [Mycobacterium malmoense]|uniref:hypothetical protein n=1 Tax=Mycobacterium malmoense TaxID=1780 RepID=UPI0008F8E997|nr:hypothetical protein [Mycobacterium malmoense]OIN79094.1 hypothetical protein BMG05_19825 [Mycobacterium malmoense]
MSIWHEPEPAAVATAVKIGAHATRGDRIAVDDAIDACSAEHWDDAVWALLRLYDHLARSLRTPLALLHVHGKIMQIACDDDRPNWRRGASLISACAQLVDATAACDNELRWLAVSQLNEALVEAAEAEYFSLVLGAALSTWRSLLPEVTPELIQAAAAEIWSDNL